MRRRTLRALAGMVAPVLALGVLLPLGTGGTASAAPSDEIEVTELGAAIEAVNVRAAAFGELADGTPVAYATSNGEPVTFNVIDLRTGESIESHSVPGEFVAGSVAPAPDGSVYFNTSDPTPGALHRYVPGEGLELIGERVAGQGWLRDIAVADDGTAYISTYPDAKLLAYHPDTGEIRDYGSVADDATYGYAVEIVGDEVWVGTGPVPHLVAVDPESGDMREIELPELDNVNYVLRLDRRGDHVFAGLSPRGSFDTLVYDLTAQEWVDTIPSVGAAGTTELDSAGLAYFLSAGTAWAYDLESNSVGEFGFEDTHLEERLAAASNTYGIGVVTIDGAETFVALTSAGELLRYDLATGEATNVEAQVLPSAVDIVGFGVGPDGNVYSGAKIGPDLIGRIQQGTHELEVLSGPSQAEGFGSHDGQIIIGSYSGAGVNVGDLGEPWEWGTNPSQMIKLDRGVPYHQDRVWTVASAGERVALGTIPEPGYNGGSITMLDTGTGEFDVHRDVIPGQSVISLLHRDGLLYGGTSINGGSGTTSVADEGELFIWDVATESVVWQGAPVPGAAVVNGLTWTPDGHLWGITESGVVFEFDPEAREVLQTTRVVDEPDSIHPWGNHTSLVHDAERGGFLGTAGWQLFFLDQETLEVEFHRTDRDTHRVVMAGNGDVYCVGTTDVCVIEGAADEEPPAQRYGFFLTDGWGGGDADHAFMYGRHSDEVLIGDWDGDGRDTITVRRGDQYFVNNAPTGGPASSVFVYGKDDDVVLVGDWDGDGTDTLAVRRGAAYHVQDSLRGGAADQVIVYGRAGDDVLVGDWNGDGRDALTVRRGATYHVKNSMRGGAADVAFTYGRTEDQVLAGDWDGDGNDTFAIRRGKAYHVNNSLRGGDADLVMQYGRAGDDVHVGDWNGDGTDTIGVRRTPQNQS